MSKKIKNQGQEIQETETTKTRSYWECYTASWLHSDEMTEEEIQKRIDEAWDYADYKEVINLMAELLVRRDNEK